MAKEKILEEDFIKICKEYDFSELRGKSVFITGATGLIGSQILLFLNYLNYTAAFEIKIYAQIRSLEKAQKVFGNVFNTKRIKFVTGDVRNLAEIDFDIDYIIHAASVTSSRDFINYPVETIDIAVNGTLNLLRLAKEKDVKSFVYLSSMEAFGITDGKGEVREKDLGYIDISKPRSSYMESKRMCENLCVCYASEYGLNVKAVRLSQVLGAGMSYSDTRVAAYFARCVIEKSDIVLKTVGATKRPILYSADAVTAIFTVLIKGIKGEIYTAANPDTFCTIRETAEMIVQKFSRGKIHVKFELNGVPVEYAPNLDLNLNVDKLRALGWKPCVGLEESYRRMIISMENESAK